MKLRLWAALVLASNLAFTPEASAQTSYFSVSLLGDIVRSSHSETAGIALDAGGETLGMALRAGTPLGGAWGVEAEFAYPAEIESETEQGVVPLLPRGISSPIFDNLRAGSTTGTVLDYVTTSLAYSPYVAASRQRNVTMSAALWFQQQLTARASLVYVGGLGFYRSSREIEFTYPPILAAFPIVLPPFVTRSIVYGVRPFAGVESRMELTDHVQVVPGIRLHGVEDGWLVRPSIALGWMF
jgi:hypothetical protein